MKINKLDYVRTEAFNTYELEILEGLAEKQGYKIDDPVTSGGRSLWRTYGVVEEGETAFYDSYFIKEGGKNITEKFREYLSNNESVITEKEFTKDNLKDGMVVTFRDEIDGDKEGVVFKGTFFSKDDNLTGGGITKIQELREDLRHNYYDYADIMKVTYMDKVLWERVEETPEQKRIKELEKIISEAQKELKELRED